MSDRELLDLLADLVDRLDPAPEHLAAQAQAALAERHDGDPLRLVTDSALTEPEDVRGSSGTRTLRFGELDLRLAGLDRLCVTGFARTGRLAVVRWPGGLVEAAIEDGWFHVDHVPHGPVKFVLRRPGRRDLATPWFVA
jgi:hypothetical protein